MVSVVLEELPEADACNTVRRQIQHMIKYRYVPFTVGKTRYPGAAGPAK